MKRTSAALLFFGLTVLAAACRPERPPERPVSPGLVTGQLSIASFSELEPMRAVAEWRGQLFAATASTLYRFDANTGDLISELLGPNGKLRGVIAFAAAGDALWVASPRELWRFDGKSWTAAPTGGPGHFGVLLSTDEGLLAGGAAGLWLLRAQGWKALLPGARITTMVASRVTRGSWIGTAGEGVYLLEGGKLSPHGAPVGQRVRDVVAITQTALGAVVALGRDARNRSVVGFYDGRYWSTFWSTTPLKLRWLLSAGEVTLLGHDRGALQLRIFTGAKASGSRGSASLIPFEGQAAAGAPSGYPLARLVASPLGIWIPEGIAFAQDGPGYAYLGTKDLGVARFDGARFRWFRTKSLMGGEERLKMGCVKAGCYFAAEGRAFHIDGSGVRHVQLGAATTRTEAFASGRNGDLWAVHSDLSKPSELVVSEFVKGSFVRRHTVPVAVPHGAPLVRFARRDPAGGLWLGLRYRDAEGEVQPWGVVAVSSAGTVIYHRSSLTPGETRPPGSLALSDDIRDVYFDGGALWVASGAGIARVQNGKFAEITENEGLASEIVYMLGKSPAGEVLAATYGGLGRYDGKAWRFDYPKPAGSGTRALLLRAGQIWAATYDGLARLSARNNVRVYRVADGLAHDRVYDLFAGNQGEIWALTGGGLSRLSWAGGKVR